MQQTLLARARANEAAVIEAACNLIESMDFRLVLPPPRGGAAQLAQSCAALSADDAAVKLGALIPFVL